MNEIDNILYSPRFRILKISGKRKAFRIENVYWYLLEQIAKSRGIELSSLIEQITSNIEDGNSTAYLRSFVAMQMVEMLDSQDREIEKLTNLISVIPAPIFIITDKRRIVSSNSQMQELLKSKLGTNANVKISFGASFDLMVADLAQGRAKIARSSFEIANGPRRIHGHVLISLVSSFGNDRRFFCVMAADGGETSK